MADCAICGAGVDDDPKRMQCPACSAHYHRECRFTEGRCITEGCPRAKAREEHPDVVRNRSLLQALLQTNVDHLFQGGTRFLWLIICGAVALGVALGTVVFKSLGLLGD